MIKILLCFALLLASVQAEAMDHRSQWGVGAALGGALAAPWSQREFENVVGSGPAGSAWARYVPGTPEVGVEISYNYFQLSKMEMKTHAIVMSFFSRQNPWGNFHPFYAFGVGYQSTKNFFTTGDWETPIFKLTAGIEFEMNDRLDIGFYFNHYTIFKNKLAEVNAHVLTPVATVTYYFGTPAPLPPAVSPTPAPVPAAPAVSKPTGPSADFENLKPQVSPAKPKAAKKPSKKPPVKRKRNR